MEDFNRKQHWENIYRTKSQLEVSWYQKRPVVSLDFIDAGELPMNAKIIDIGGGDGFLVDCLLEKGYTNITVLDISATAIEKAKQRLAGKASLVKWIVADITAFQPEEQYDVWHDRAVFHFLTNDADIEIYRALITKSIKQNGTFIVGTFSEDGPKKCSGIDIKQYSSERLIKLFEVDFEHQTTLFQNHKTPFDTFQHFVFCTFIKK